MDLKTMVRQIPPHLKMMVKNIKLSPSLGYEAEARFEDLQALDRWLATGVGEAYRCGTDVNVTLEALLKHADKTRPCVVQELRHVLNKH